MRAHFATDDAPASNESCDKIESEPLEARIDDFKRDTQNMEVLTEFIDDVLQKAETEVVKKQDAVDDAASAAAETNGKASQQTKEKSRQNFKNGKVVNRARGLVVRIFDAICNCANSAAAPAQRLKLRGKRGSASQNKPEEQAEAEKPLRQDQEKDMDKAKEKETEKEQEKAEEAVEAVAEKVPLQ